MPRGWRILLCALLMVWVPVNFAAELASALPTLAYRGPAAAVELLAHGFAAAFAFAAGRSLWAGGHDALRFAGAALIVATVSATQPLFWTALPSQTKPGDEWPLAGAYLLHASAWLWYLRRRARLSR